MAGRHRARKQSIQIIRTATVKPADCRRPSTKQFHVRLNCNLLMYLTDIIGF